MSIKTEAMIVAGIGLGLYFIYDSLTDSIGDGAEVVIDAIDPTNPENLINTLFTDAYQWVTGSNDDLGGDIYDGVQNVKAIFK